MVDHKTMTMMTRVSKSVVLFAMSRRVFFLSLCFLTVLNLFAQQNDFETWYGIGASHKLSKHITANLNCDIRFNDNSTRFKKFQSDFGADYEFAKWVKTGLYYRYTRYNNYPKYYQSIHAFYLDLKFDKEVSRVDFSYRMRFQYNFYEKKGQVVTEYFSRNKFAVEYDVYESPFSPWVSYEVAFLLFDPKQQGNSMDKYRWLIGCKYALNRTNEFNLYYGLQHSFDEQEDVNMYILGVDYNHKF